MQAEIPDGWTWSRIGDHFKRITRKNKAGVQRVLTASGEHGLIDQEEYFNKRVAARNTDGYFHLKRGEFAYNRSAMSGYPFGATKRLDRYDDGVLSTLYLCFGLRPEAGVLSDYATQLFDSDVLHSELQPIVRVGARAHGLLNVTPSDFMEVALPLPPLPEQEKIAAVLASVDEAVRATEAVIKQTRRVKDGLLQDLLTRGIGHTQFKQTEIGEIPATWEVRKLRDVTASRDSERIPLKAEDRLERQGEYRYYGASGVIDYIDDFIFDGPNLLVAEDGFNLLRRATPIASVVDGQYWVNNHAHVLGSTDRADLHFLAAVFARLDIRPYLTGFEMPKLNAKALGSVKVPVPPIAEQRQIAERLLSADAAEEASMTRVEQLQQVKAGLLQDLLTGAVRVSP